ncbi:hypothetical protein SteCoe_23178 [Stentor coeruleus]|uniref:Globin family profile domain-containing protein n=1 Tax=Stentor coeruleus TaxID=5963 RepID=A0A1R2BKH8_9CILI|nr:hypothetical protein SteCoe_24708 [Stentor coeruleus]OMJ77269.1 hypothetical protein SteCoe_23178 [Stentor coeruleus]
MSLYHKYGGITFWNEVLNCFYNKALQSKKIAHFLTPENFYHIQAMLISQLEISLGELGRYSMKGLMQIHMHLEITSSQYNEWISLYKDALIENYVLYEDIEKIIKIFQVIKQYIVYNNY